MINELHISTIYHDWQSTNLVLADQSNIDKLIAQSAVVNCHTSVEDLSCSNLSKACTHAQKIIVVNIDQNIQTTNDNNGSYGRLFYELHRNRHKVQNFEFTKTFDNLQQQRNTDDPVLWNVGCSVTKGIGVLDDQRWGALLASMLGVNEINIAAGGSSIFWAADQLLRSDIRPNDIVVWGLTTIARVETSVNWDLQILATINHYVQLDKKYQYWNIDYFDSETQALKAIRHVLQVENFCKKIGAKFYIANILDISWLAMAFKDFENFIDLTQDLPIIDNKLQFVDIGIDNLHPGPTQHIQYAEKLYNFIKDETHGQTI